MQFCTITARVRRAFFFFSLALFTLPAIALAQGVTGVISGTVTDPAKAPIPGATVTMANADTGATAWTGRTNDRGVYRAPNLPVGRYNVTVDAGGFKKQQVLRELQLPDRLQRERRSDRAGLNQRIDCLKTVEGGTTNQLGSLRGDRRSVRA